MLDAFLALDLKVFDPLGAAAADVAQRGAFVAFGNTAPQATRVDALSTAACSGRRS